MQRIKNDIKTEVFANAYLLYGPECYLTEYYSRQIIAKTVEPGSEEFNLLKLTAPLPEEGEIDSFVNSYPFMSDKKVVFVRNSGILKRATEAQKSFWGELFKSIPDYMIIIFAEDEVDKRNALFKQLSKCATACEFAFQKPTELAPWIAKVLKSCGKEISRQDALNIAEICGPGMQNLKNELDKLAAYTGERSAITGGDIESVITKNVENRVFAMVDDIADGRGDDALKKLNDLKSLGEEPIKIISIIFNKFSTYKKLSILKDRPMREICSACGLYEKYARVYMSQLNRLGIKRINSVMEKCMETDFAVKSGKTDKWLAVELILSEAMKK